MKKGISILITVMMIFTMIGAVSGCGVNKAEADELFAGVLVDAQNSRVVVRGDSETMLFVTNEETVYDLQGEPELTIGDQIEVSYHKGDSTFIADSVTLKVHEKQALVFGGQVTELEEKYLTVQSQSLTAVFNYDAETKIVGDLSKGDTVTVTYEGNISENPKAVNVVVIQEMKEIEQKTIHGTVSELGAESVVISIDSAHAARFHLTSQTTYGGDDTKLKLGDEVNMVYTGDVGADPVAVSIKIKRKQQPKYLIVDGVIEKVNKKSIVIRTSRKAYTIGIDKKTKIQNPDYMEVGHKTTITYVGELGKDAVATSIFCSKDVTGRKDLQPANKEKKQEDKAKPEEKKSDSSSEPSKSGDDKDSGKPDQTPEPSSQDEEQKPDESAEPADSGDQQPDESAEPADSGDQQPDESAEPADSDKGQDSEEADKPDQPSEPEESSADKEQEKEPVIIKGRGLVAEWGDTLIVKVEGSGVLKLDAREAKISGGYIPELGDQVLISYDKDTMKLIEIQLEYRPTVEETPES